MSNVSKKVKMAQWLAKIDQEISSYGDIDQQSFDEFLNQKSGSLTVGDLLLLSDSRKGGVVLSDKRAATQILHAIAGRINTDFSRGQVSLIGQDPFTPLLKVCPISSSPWRGYRSVSLSRINLIAPSGAGKSVWVEYLQSLGVNITDTDALMFAIEMLARGLDPSTSLRGLEYGWYKKCNERLKDGVPRYLAASSRVKGLVESLRLVTTGVLGWNNYDITRAGEPSTKAILINVMLERGWEEYIMTCWGRAASDCINEGKGKVHWLPSELVKLQNERVRGTNGDVLEIGAYQSQNRKVAENVLDFLYHSQAWWAYEESKRTFNLSQPIFKAGWARKKAS